MKHLLVPYEQQCITLQKIIINEKRIGMQISCRPQTLKPCLNRHIFFYKYQILKAHKTNSCSVGLDLNHKNDCTTTIINHHTLAK